MLGDLSADMIPMGPCPGSAPRPSRSIEGLEYQAAALGDIDIGKFFTSILTPSQRQIDMVKAIGGTIISPLAQAGVFSSSNQQRPAGYQSAGGTVPSDFDQSMLPKKDNTETILLVGGAAVVVTIAALLLLR